MQEITHAVPYMAQDTLSRRQMEVRQLVHHIHLRFAEPARMLHDEREDEATKDTEQVQRHEHQCFMIGKEDGDKQHIHRQSCRATHERNHQHGESTFFGVGNILGSHDGGHVTVKAHQHRDKRTTVQSEPVHQSVSQEGHTRHITRILHDTEEKEEYDDIGQCSKQTAYTDDDTIAQQTLQPTGSHVRLHQFIERINAHLQPILQRTAQEEGAFKRDTQNDG